MTHKEKTHSKEAAGLVGVDVGGAMLIWAARDALAECRAGGVARRLWG